MSDFSEEQDQKRRDYARERREKSEQLIEDFSELVNRGADSKALHDKFCREHRTLQQSMFREIIGLIIMMSKDDYQTDPRNEYAKKMAQNIIKGYGEILRQEDIARLVEVGYTVEEATEKADKNSKYFFESPERYMGLSCI